MKEYNGYSAKGKKQLAVCQHLIIEKSYPSQGKIHRDLQNHGFNNISQPTVSRPLKLLGIMKIKNTKEQKIYSMNLQLLPTPDAGQPVAEMALSVEHNGEFILIHTVAEYGRAATRILDSHVLPETLGMIAGSNIVWATPRVVRHATLTHK